MHADGVSSFRKDRTLFGSICCLNNKLFWRFLGEDGKNNRNKEREPAQEVHGQ